MPRTMTPSNTVTRSNKVSTTFFQQEQHKTQPVLSPAELEQLEHESALIMVLHGIPVGHHIHHYSYNTQVLYHMLHIIYGSLGTIQIPREMYHEFYESALQGNQEAYIALKKMAKQNLCFTEDRCIALIYMTIIHRNYFYIHKAYTLNSDAVMNYLSYLRSIERISTSLLNQVCLFMHASTSHNQNTLPDRDDNALSHESLYLEMSSRTIVSTASKPSSSGHTDELNVEDLSLDEFLSAFSVN